MEACPSYRACGPSALERLGSLLQQMRAEQSSFAPPGQMRVDRTRDTRVGHAFSLFDRWACFAPQVWIDRSRHTRVALALLHCRASAGLRSFKIVVCDTPQRPANFRLDVLGW